MDAVKLFLLALTTYLIYAKEAPKLTSSGTNVTVVVGRDATLTCNVENLQNYKVAWLRVDTQTVLTIGQHVITKNHRVGVSRGEPQSWALTLRDARSSDTGQYMCQINTNPMIVQTHQLQVFVPPNIVDSDSSGEMIVEEGGSMALHCAASGTPKPSITWKREDSKSLIIGDNVLKLEGEWLNVTSAHRDMNGALLCIASNGVPPSVSKRILLHVLCKPRVEVRQKLVGANAGDTAILQCRVEAYPPPEVYWTDMYKKRLTNGLKYEIKKISHAYEHIGSLKINNVSRENVGPYQCHAENSLGTDNDSLTLYTLATTTASSTSTVQNVTSSDPVTTVPTNFSYTSAKIENGHTTADISLILSQHQMQNPDVVTTS